MNDSKYLYDLDISQLANVPYQDVLLLKLNSVKKTNEQTCSHRKQWQRQGQNEQSS